jgi:serine protease
VNSSVVASNLIVNGGFETGTTTAPPWTLTAGVLNTSASEPPHAGTKDAWMDGYGTTHTDTSTQSVTIPATATTATLTFFLHIDTAETTTTTAFDTLTVQVLNSAGTVLQTLGTFSNLNKAAGYTQRSLPITITSIKGTTVQIRFTGKEDASLQTSFVIDDVALNVQ